MEAAPAPVALPRVDAAPLLEVLATLGHGAAALFGAVLLVAARFATADPEMAYSRVGPTEVTVSGFLQVQGAGIALATMAWGACGLAAWPQRMAPHRAGLAAARSAILLLVGLAWLLPALALWLLATDLPEHRSNPGPGMAGVGAGVLAAWAGLRWRDAQRAAPDPATHF